MINYYHKFAFIFKLVVTRNLYVSSDKPFTLYYKHFKLSNVAKFYI
jgi:hypothetical protein